MLALQDAVAGKVGKKRYELWFGSSARLTLEGQTLRIGLPNQCFLDWIRGNFRRHIDEACVDVLGNCPTIDFHLLSDKPSSDRTEANPSRQGNLFDTSSRQKNHRTADLHATVGLACPTRETHSGILTIEATPHLENDMESASPFEFSKRLETASGSITPAFDEESTKPRADGGFSDHSILSRSDSRIVTKESAASESELPLNLSGVRKFASLESFVVGASNKLAITSAEMVIRQPGQISPLLIHGPTSVGKTHLLEGIWTAIRKRSRNATVMYLSAEQFTSQFLEALRGSGLPSFRRKYRGVGLLILDDLQFLVGKRATQIELLHTIDTLMRERRQLVFASDRSPAELAELGPELTTRLSSGMVCRIDPPDFVTRLGIVEQLAKRMRLSMPRDAQEYVASKLTSHARELSGALCRLQATSEALSRPISLKLAEEALGEMIHSSSRSVRLGDIEKAVCEVFGLDPSCLQADDKSTRVSHPRMLAMWLARKHTRAALSEIGHYFGKRSHSTVVSAQKRVDGWMSSGRPMQLAERTWEVDEAIRQVERQLTAGLCSG